MSEATSKEIVFGNGDAYSFPENPFESIGFALSGGGFRAAAYGLGTLSVLDALYLDDAGFPRPRLLDKVRFISSASGGTITLLVYAAAIRKGISFVDFFRHLDQKLTGEALLQEALAALADESQWEEGQKARNPINAFARTYHNSLLSLLPKNERHLGFLMEPQGVQVPHVEEFCFNASEFYTGLSFRFQGAEKDWKQNSGGRLGNNNIGIEWDHGPESFATLKRLRLADIVASSSCFPLGFEPIMYPRDFTYPGGPSADQLKAAIRLDTYSWGKEPKYAESNRMSRRAADEKKFADAKEFGLMDGGICDNQGLYSLLEANKRKIPGKKAKPGPCNRFDLMMVSDVTSFYMGPYHEPAVKDNSWNQKTPQHYWDLVTGFVKKIKKWLNLSIAIAAGAAVLTLLPLFLEGVSVASMALGAIGFILLGTAVFANFRYRDFLKSESVLSQALQTTSIGALYRHHFPNTTFINRIGATFIDHLQETRLEVLTHMLLSRAQSAVTMISDVFLKHIRRLIYDQLFSNPTYKYRRLDNPIYRLTYTNNKNRRQPSFDEREGEPKEDYDRRYRAFVDDVKASCRLTPAMQNLAEIAYNASTTLWFTPAEETTGNDNVRKAIIATGQFSTCYSLLRYTLSLKHSREFARLAPDAQKRVENILRQLREMMEEFERDPHFLYRRLVAKSKK